MTDTFAPRSLEDVIEELSIPGAGGDPAAAAAGIEAAILSRRRRRRVAAAAAAVLVVVLGVTAMALTGSDEPSEVVAGKDSAADGDGTTATTVDPLIGSGSVVTAIPTTTVPIAPVVTAPVTIPAPTVTPQPSIVPTTRPAPAPGAPPAAPPASAPPTGAPPQNPGGTPGTTSPPPPAPQPTEGTLRLTPAPVGEVVRVVLEWTDRDLPRDAELGFVIVATRGGVQIQAAKPAGGTCSGTTPASGTLDTGLRLPEGTWKVELRVAACDAPATTFAGSVEVGPSPGRSGVLAVADDLVPESGTWTFEPDSGDPVPLRNDADDSVPDNDPSVHMLYEGRPATVLAVPDGAGALRHQVAGCIRTARADGAVVDMGGCLP